MAHISLPVTSLCKAEGFFGERIRCWITPAPRDVSVQHQWQRRRTRKTSHCTNQYKHNTVCSWRLLWAENTDSHLYPRPRWWRQHLRLSNIRGCSQGRLSTYVARFQLVSLGDTEFLYTTYHINHRWLIKQPWWMEKLQTIHLLHHIGGNERTGARQARVSRSHPSCYKGASTSSHPLRCLWGEHHLKINPREPDTLPTF